MNQFNVKDATADFLKKEKEFQEGLRMDRENYEKARKTEQETDEQLRAMDQYNDEGYTIVENLFSMEELQPVLNEFDDIVDEYAEKAFSAGKITNKTFLKHLEFFLDIPKRPPIVV